MHHRLAALTLLTLLSACSDDPLVCTLVGAEDQIVIDAREVASEVGAVQLCLAGRDCRPRIDLLEGQAFVSETEGLALESEPTSIEIRLLDGQGAPVATAAGVITPTTLAPNGEECGPVVSVARVRLDADGSSFRQVALGAD